MPHPLNTALAAHLESTIPRTETPSYWAQTLRRACAKIRKQSIPIRCREDAKAIPGIGDKIASLIEVYLIEQNVRMPVAPSARAAAAAAALRRHAAGDTGDVAQDAAVEQPLISSRQSGRPRAPLIARPTDRRSSGRPMTVVAGGVATPAGLADGDEETTMRRGSGGRGGRGGSVAAERQAPSGARVLGDDEEEEEAPVGRGRGRGRGRGSTAMARRQSAARVDERGGGTPRRGRGRGSSAGTPRRGREYRPKYRGCAYALLIAMYELKQEGVERAFKEEIVERAEPYSDEEIIGGNKNWDPSSWYDGWSCMGGTLRKKGLVIMAGRPAWYELTEAGEGVAKWCVEVEGGAGERVETRYGGDGRVLGGCGGKGGSRGGENGVSEEEIREASGVFQSALDGGCEFGQPGDVRVGRREKRVGRGVVERASRVVGRLERDGLGREECLRALGEVFERGLPRGEDALYEAVSEGVWKRREESERETGRLGEGDMQGEGVRKNGERRSDGESSICEVEETRNDGRMRCGKRAVGDVMDLTEVMPRKRAREERGVEEDDVICIDDDEPAVVGTSADVVEDGRPPVEHGRRAIDVDGEEVEVCGEVVEIGRQAVETLREARTEARNNLQRLINSPTGVQQTPPHRIPRQIVLILDYRERTARSRRAEEVASMKARLQRMGVECETRTLPVGDAVFIARYGEEEVVLDYIIERKRADDYASSLRDGRVAMQSHMMRYCGLGKRMFVLESNVKQWDDGRMEKTLAELEVCEGFYIKRTKNLQETLVFYTCMFERVKRGRCGGSVSFKDWMERMEKYRSGLTVQRMFFIQLCQIKGIGKDTALAIMAKYDTPAKLFQAVRGDWHVEGVNARTRRIVTDLVTMEQYPTVVIGMGSGD